MRIPLIVLIFQGVPEGIAIYTLAFVLAKIDLNWRKIIVGAFFSILIVYLIRFYPVYVGLHTIVMITFLFFYLFKVGRASVLTSLVATLLSFLILCLTEAACIHIIELLGLSSQGYLSSQSLRIITGLPHVSLMFLFAFLIKYYRKRKDIRYDHSLEQTNEQSFKQ